VVQAKANFGLLSWERSSAMADASVRPDLSPEQFLTGLVSALALRTRVLEGKRSELHRAFYRAIKGAAGEPFRGVAAIDYDPLYAVSPWFDRALTNAQSLLLIDFSNPSYKKVVIRVERDEGERRLASTGMADEFRKLADALLAELPSRT
jgi:hypothetical protein